MSDLITEDIELLVLKNLIFPETVSNLLEDTQLEKHILLDVIKQLIQKGLVSTVLNNTNLTAKTEIYYDSDHMETYSYKISAKGLSEMGF